MDQNPPPATNKSFAHWLDAELRIRRLTQRGLAQRAGVNHSTITRLLQGDRVPSLATATRIADALGKGAGRESLADAGDPIPVGRVRAALRADPVLGEVDVSAVMRLYLTVRNGRAQPASRGGSSR
jgi:transcriptional regulator with XRE-family HTH domain